MKTIKDNGWRNVLEQCLEFKDKKQLEVFFEVLLTVSEREEIGKRFLIIKELIENKNTQREIAHKLNVSIFNVSRGSNILKTCKYDFKKILRIKRFNNDI